MPTLALEPNSYMAHMSAQQEMSRTVASAIDVDLSNESFSFSIDATPAQSVTQQVLNAAEIDLSNPDYAFAANFEAIAGLEPQQTVTETLTVAAQQDFSFPATTFGDMAAPFKTATTVGLNLEHLIPVAGKVATAGLAVASFGPAAVNFVKGIQSAVSSEESSNALAA